MKKKLSKLSLLLIAVLLLGMISYASEDTQITANTAMKVSTDATLYESASDSSNAVTTLASGTPVIVREDAKDGWCKVSYKDTYGYVKTESLAALVSADEISPEFADMQKQVQLLFDSIIVREQEEKRSRIWGAIIVVLVVVIFGVGIISSIKGKDKKDGKTAEGK